jgi:hypothetical protein
LKRAFGIDLARVPGIQFLDDHLSRRRHQRRKVLWAGTRKSQCRAAKALRMAAQSLHHRP